LPETGRPAALTLDRVNRMDAHAFLAALGGVFEHSPWIAERAFSARPFASVAALRAAMADVVHGASDAEKLILIRAHPDLAGRAARAGAMTEFSVKEQSGARLDRMTDAEFERFDRLNAAYRAKFGFPFIAAARDHDRASILAAFEARLANTLQAEIAEAIRNVLRIAELRLADTVTDETSVA